MPALRQKEEVDLSEPEDSVGLQGKVHQARVREWDFISRRKNKEKASLVVG